MNAPLRTTPSRQSLATPFLRRTRVFFVPAVMLLLILSAILAPAAQAQSPISGLTELEVELWPDFDRPEVLVLLTGTLAEGVSAPATLTIPLPEEASINAVAHVSLESGAMENIVDVDSGTPGQLTFTTPSPTFRIEYYVPYSADGDRRVIAFDWKSEMTIDQVLATVQQPVEAEEFELTPAAEQVSTGQDGLVYHALAAQALSAGQSFSLSASYNLPGGQLSADVLAAQQPAVEGPLPLVSEPAESGDSGFNWAIVAIVAGGLIIVAAVAWFLYTNSNTGRKRTPRPRPVRQQKARRSRPSSPASKAQFCHNCGQPLDAEDRFCRECGTAVKER